MKHVMLVLVCSINLNILECKSDTPAVKTVTVNRINLNILEC